MSIYEIVTERVIQAIEKGGVLPWRKPWGGPSSRPKNLVTGKCYRGVNVMLLAMQGFSSPYWLSFNQAKKQGGTVRKGEKGTPVIYWSVTEKENKVTGQKEKVFFAKYYTVFNVEQIQSIQAPADEVSASTSIEKIERCEQIVEAYQDRPTIQERDAQAYYSPSKDLVNMPKRNSFESSQEWYSTLFHELAHSTGHAKRLNRPALTNTSFFGSHTYSKEELCAEMAACFLCAEAEIATSTQNNSVAYLNGWISALKGNSRLIIEAASQGQKASDYILGRTHETDAEINSLGANITF